MTTDWSDFGRKFVRRVSKIKELVQREVSASKESPPVVETNVEAPAEPEQKPSQATMIKATENGDLPNLRSQTVDIGKQQIGKVYAKALLSATETSDSAAVLTELGTLVGEVFEKTPGFQAALSSPQVTVPEKLKLIDSTLGGRVSKELLRFLKVVCEHGRLDCLASIYQAARTLLNERKGVVEVTMVTAAPVDASVVAEVKQSLQQKLGADVSVSPDVDPKLLGGILIRVGDKVYDGSVARKLELLRDQAVAKTVSQMRDAGSKFAPES